MAHFALKCNKSKMYLPACLPNPCCATLQDAEHTLRKSQRRVEDLENESFLQKEEIRGLHATMNAVRAELMEVRKLYFRTCTQRIFYVRETFGFESHVWIHVYTCMNAYILYYASCT